MIDWAPVDAEGDIVLFVFDGGTLSADQLNTVTFTDGEVGEFRFVDRDELETDVPDRLAWRIHSTLSARRDGRAIYAEHGTPVAHAADWGRNP